MKLLRISLVLLLCLFLIQIVSALQIIGYQTSCTSNRLINAMCWGDEDNPNPQCDLNCGPGAICDFTALPNIPQYQGIGRCISKTSSGPVCGDNVCNSGETQNSCPVDCRIYSPTITTTPLAPVQTCVDSDGGWNLDKFGFVSMGGNVICEDRCGVGPVDNLFECFCGNKQGSGGGQGSGWVTCPNGCNNGACSQTPPKSVCGNNVLESGEECDTSIECPDKPGAQKRCNSGCVCEYQIIVKTPTFVCGDGICEPGELCSKDCQQTTQQTLTQQPIQQPPQILQNPTQQACTNSGGSWKTFSNTCADSCSIAGKQPGTYMCGMAMTDSCDCGANNCWDGNKCVSNPQVQNLPVQPPIVQPVQQNICLSITCPQGQACIPNQGCISVTTQPPTTQQAMCGNGICETGENTNNCPYDCQQTTQQNICLSITCPQGQACIPNQGCISVTTQPPTTQQAIPTTPTRPSLTCITPDNTVIAQGARWNYDYCDLNGVLQKQRINDEICEHSFECKSYYCDNNLCKDKKSIIGNIFGWIKNVIGLSP